MSNSLSSENESTAPTIEVEYETPCNHQGLEDVEDLNDDRDKDLLEPIAVIGFSLEFPQDATSPEAFWQMLLDGVSTSTTIPADRFNVESFYDADPNRTGTVW